MSRKSNKSIRITYIARTVIIDILLIGICLCTFAYFHHVRKKDVVSENIEIDLSQAFDEGGSTSVIYWRDLYADKFSDEVIQDDRNYRSKDISVSISETTEEIDDNTVIYYIADVYIADIQCLRRYFAKGNVYGQTRDEILDMDIESNAVVTLSGDTYGSQDDGIVIQDGVVCRSTKSPWDICVLFADGTMKTYLPDDFVLEDIMEQSPWQAWSFGPMLLDENGKVLEKFNSSNYIKIQKHPRAGIGYYAPGHYCFVIVEGRSDESAGVSIADFAKIFEDLGCKAAYNLDGGGSSCITCNDKYVSKQSGNERRLSDCIILVEQN